MLSEQLKRRILTKSNVLLQEEGEILDEKTEKAKKAAAKRQKMHRRMVTGNQDVKAIRRFRTAPYPNRTVNDTLKKWGVDMSAKIPDGQKIT